MDEELIIVDKEVIKRQNRRFQVNFLLFVVAVLAFFIFLTPQKQTVKIIRETYVFTPSSHLYAGMNYKQVVNRARGLTLHHVFYFGKYVKGVWTPTGQIYKW